MNTTPEKDLVTKIHGAGTEERREDRLQVWEDIQKGLVSNCRNYELYMRLGNYYLEENPDQSYLCYENALFYCDVPDQRTVSCSCEEDFHHHFVVQSAGVHQAVSGKHSQDNTGIREGDRRGRQRLQ